MSAVFGLFSALLALVTMRILGTADLDPIAYFTGIALSGIVGVGTAMALRRAQSSPHVRGISWLLVPVATGSTSASSMSDTPSARRPNRAYA